MDEQVASINITSNIIWNCGAGAIAFHCGTNQNGTGNLIVNNTVQKQGGGTLDACNGGGNPTWPNISHGFAFRQNVVVIPEQGALSSTFEDFRASNFSDNCYWKMGGNVSNLRFYNTKTNRSQMYRPTWNEWRATGQDQNSIVADPQLQWLPVASLGGIHVPMPARSSPVWSLGFRPIDLDLIGPRQHKSDDRLAAS